jgi:hypothetical protein
LNEVRKGANPESEVTFVCRDLYDHEALCRAIEQHEAFRQEVSDAVKTFKDGNMHTMHDYLLEPFIIPKPKSDPLAEIIGELDDGTWGETKAEYADRIRAALDARGLEIREKGND